MKTLAGSPKSSVLKLDANDIHVWIVQPRYICQPDLLARYKSVLAEDELKKQQSYIFEEKRHNALVTRVFVRDLLSHYDDISPRCWQFKVGYYGKPEIVNSDLPLKFNISHTDELIICVVTLNHDIGCDVEMINRNCDFLSIAKSFFSSGEFNELISNEHTLQRSRFFDYWTLKESYIKACGQGLSIPLSDFTFNISSTKLRQFNDNINLNFVPVRFDSAEHWRHWLFYPNSDYRIAVSVKTAHGNQARPYKFRYFENTPLVKTRELNWLGFC